ncbi:hypothetical protein B0J13DRAFT_600917 [Dactylonectria estremocensis]|uniref:WSC domain-containing protein n=1 Tax=Dactylonectria estremocensis TaxID=1079267 RepID=A0A9P9JD97_9HYPO|nr:hypothetical protein B0J13DRAFT_600917 [Dactylonectria estremocensis]
MCILLIIAILGISGSLTQEPYVGDSFTYWGCGKVDPSGFGQPIVFPAGQLTPESCQAACMGQQFAAVSPEFVTPPRFLDLETDSHRTCRCGDNPDAIISIDEGACDYPCTEDPDSPKCGGICPDEIPNISNVFVIIPELTSDEAHVPEAGEHEDQSTASDPPLPTMVQITTTATRELPVESSGDTPITPIPLVPQGLTPAVTPKKPTSPTRAPLQTSVPVSIAKIPSPAVSEQMFSVTSDALAESFTISEVPTWEVASNPSVVPASSSSDPVVPQGPNLTGPPSGNMTPGPSTPDMNGVPPVPAQITGSDSSRFETSFITAFVVVFLVATMVNID